MKPDFIILMCFYKPTYKKLIKHIFDKRKLVLIGEEANNPIDGFLKPGF